MRNVNAAGDGVSRKDLMAVLKLISAFQTQICRLVIKEGLNKSPTYYDQKHFA